MGAIDDVTQALVAKQQEPPQLTMGDLVAVGNPMGEVAPPAPAGATAWNPVGSAVSHVLGSLADFVKTPGRLANTPNPYPPGSEEGIEFERTRQNAGDDWARNAALATMGTGSVAGLPVGAGEAVLGAGPIRAYHGSPHDFDAFSLDKIGIGEGAQAYGHGLYFAESPRVAQSYRDGLAPGQKMTLNGVPYDQLTPGQRRVAQWIENTGAHPEEIARISDERAAKTMADAKDMDLDEMGSMLADEHLKTAQAARDLASQGKWEVGRAPNGKMYEVQINADPEHFLNWDKPLSEQSEVTNKLQAMYDALGRPENIAKDYPSARDFIDDFHNNLNIPDEGMAQMRQAGIPGIKYLDQGSRAAGDGSHNYVVFDDKLIDILRKYGMGSVAALPPTLAALQQQPPANPGQ